jgi:hypothetical protein
VSLFFDDPEILAEAPATPPTLAIVAEDAGSARGIGTVGGSVGLALTTPVNKAIVIIKTSNMPVNLFIFIVVFLLNKSLPVIININ